MRSLVAFLVIGSCVGCARPAPTASTPRVFVATPERVTSREAAITKLCEDRRAAKDVGSLRVGIVDGDRIWERSFGEVDTPSGKRLADGDTLFEIGSITKSFTALLLADMVARGEVRLDQPFAELLPPGTLLGTPTLGTVTLAQLASHRSGLPTDWPTFDETVPHDPYRGFTEAALYAGLAKIGALKTPPGSTYAYNNHAFALLGHTLARKLGKSYEAALLERVLSPLGMLRTFLDVPAPLQERLVRGHDERGDEAYNWSVSAIAPAGSLRSTMPDMLRYARAVLRAGDALGGAIALATTPREAGPGEGISVGLGFHVIESGRIVFHNGQSAMHAFLAVDRAHGVGVVILSDRRGMAVDALGLAILHLVRGDIVKPLPVPVKLAAPQRAALVGTYRLTPELSIEIADEPDGMTARVTGQAKRALVASSPTSLLIEGTEIRLELSLGASGRAEKLVLHQDGRELPATREPERARP